MNALLEVKDLRTSFTSEYGALQAVDEVSFSVGERETLGIIGESGCGKSVTALSIMGLIRQPPGRIRGSIRFLGRELLSLGKRDMEDVRGAEIAMIFQEPMTSLHPMHRCGFQLTETIRRHKKTEKRDADREAVRLFGLVGIPDPKRVASAFPHELSGGMRQRVLVAIALSCRPKLLIADEITTAVDVTIQAQVLELLRRLKDEFGMSIILITHDMGVIAEMAERVAVMYMGRIVEEADVFSLFKSPGHPYTRGLLASIPRIDTVMAKKAKLPTIEGRVPNLHEIPSGCGFRPRCANATVACEKDPPMVALSESHRVRCWQRDG